MGRQVSPILWEEGTQGTGLIGLFQLLSLSPSHPTSHGSAQDVLEGSNPPKSLRLVKDLLNNINFLASVLLGFLGVIFFQSQHFF